MKLPSKLTSFEQFLYFDDYPAYPNTIGCRLRLRGTLDESLFDRAVQLVCDRNPLFKTTLENRWSGPRWSACHDRTIVEQLSDHLIEAPFVKKIDLDKEAGGQVHWASDSDQASINFLTHHATADGIGGLQVVADWLAAYAAMTEATSDVEKAGTQSTRRTNLDLLDKRASYGFCRWRFLKTIPRQMIGVFGVKEFIANRPVSLTGEPPVDVAASIPADYPGVHSAEFGDVERVRSQAGTENVTTNDLILQCIFIAIAKWRRIRSIGSEKDLIRLMVPINLRSLSDRYLPASLRSSIVTLDRPQERCTDEKEFLDTIRFQMNVIKANELGYTFLHVLNFSKWLPRGIKRYANPHRVGATALVTNLGEPFKRVKLPRDDEGKLRVGNMTLEGLDLIAPLRPHTNAAFAIYRYAGKTVLSLTYDNRVMQAEDAKQLTQMVCDEFHSKTKNAFG